MTGLLWLLLAEVLGAGLWAGIVDELPGLDAPAWLAPGGRQGSLPPPPA